MENKEFNNSYLNQAISLLNTCFPKKQVSEKSFIWKHYDIFFNNKTISMIATDSGKICSLVCFTPVLIAKGKIVCQNFYSCAVQATHPNYRRQGIISGLTKLAEKRIGSSVSYIGFSNNNGIKIDKFSKKINYKILGQMNTRYVLSLPYKTSLVIKKTDKISWQKNECSNFFALFKNDEYLNWRYAQNPKNNYKYFKILKDKDIIGYIIYKNDKIKYEVTDLLLKNYDAKLYNEAIRSFAEFSLRQGKILVSYSCLENKFWQECFPILSFKNKISVYFTIKTANTCLLNLDNWIIQGGDIQ